MTLKALTAFKNILSGIQTSFHHLDTTYTTTTKGPDEVINSHIPKAEIHTAVIKAIESQ